MELIIPAVKYVFVVALGVEALLIARAIYQVAREKARAAQAPAAQAEK